MLTALLVVTVGALGAQDRMTRAIVPDQSPIDLEDGVFFGVGSLLSIAVRNRFDAPVQVSLRAWVFDQQGRLKGTNAFCSGEPIDRTTRRAIGFPIEVRGVDTHDLVVVVVDRVASERWTWRLREPVADQLDAARAQALTGGGHLTMEKVETAGWPVEPCPCVCETIVRRCDGFCADTGLAAFTCTPAIPAGCSASCTCK